MVEDREPPELGADKLPELHLGEERLRRIKREVGDDGRDEVVRPLVIECAE